MVKMKGKKIWIVIIMLMIGSFCEICIAKNTENARNIENDFNNDEKLSEVFLNLLIDRYEKNKEIPSGLMEILRALELIR